MENSVKYFAYKAGVLGDTNHTETSNTYLTIPLWKPTAVSIGPDFKSAVAKYGDADC